jgi:hypothetical protein
MGPPAPALLGADVVDSFEQAQPVCNFDDSQAQRNS